MLTRVPGIRVRKRELTSSLPRFIPRPSFLARPVPVPAVPAAPLVLFPFEAPVDEDAAAEAWLMSAFCIATLASLNLRSRCTGTHSSHLHAYYVNLARRSIEAQAKCFQYMRIVTYVCFHPL